MIKIENQIIFFKGKRVDFDALPSEIQEKLLNSWKNHNKKDYDKIKKSGDSSRTNSGEPEGTTSESGSETASKGNSSGKTARGGANGHKSTGSKAKGKE